MKRLAALTGALALLSACGPPDSANEPVMVAGGQVLGVLVDDVREFKGIPYAAPPVGSLRWRPPQRVVGWEGIRDGSAFGAECPQAVPAETTAFAPQSEDCLFLNVWAPVRTPSPRPVLVWLHSGDLMSGSGARDFTSGIPLARKGIIVVSMNYRLGALGYLAHPELSAESEEGVSGNYGLLDQVAALEWVRDNITLFGGDPARVTVAGHSGGADSISALIASPRARGLFARATAQSGGWFGPGRPLRNGADGEETAEQAGEQFARALLGTVPDESLRVLRSSPTDAIVSTDFRPRETVDGWVLPNDIRTVFAEKQQQQVPVMLGLTSAEVASGDDDLAERMNLWASFASAGGSTVYLFRFAHQSGGAIRYFFDALSSLAPGSAPVTYTSADHALAELMSTYWANFMTAADPNSPGLPEWPPYDADTEPYLELGGRTEARQHLFSGN
jgi:para-nitrobenzyl esterase